jgi:glycosyltransferase involved in cell wall biosynthesis
MKIAMLAPTSIPARTANSLQVMKVSQALSGLGHEVRVVAPAFASTDRVGHNWQELARHYGLQQAFSIEWLPAHPRFRRYDYAVRAVSWARKWRADILYTRLPQAAALSSLLGNKTILETHDLPQGRLGPWLFRLFLKGSGARRLVVITRSLAASLERDLGVCLSPPFTIVAADGVDLTRYTNLPAAPEARLRLEVLQSRQACFTAGYTGHLYAGRGGELMIELAARHPDISFLLAGGEPPDIARLQALADSQRLDNVILTGFIPNADLPLYQAASDVLMMPYQKHVAASSGGDIAAYLSPMKLFEYLACGRAILSSDLPVLREVLNPDNAVLLDPEDVEGWSTALRLLQNDAQRREILGGNARRDASLYTWEARARAILAGMEASHA